MTRGLKVGLLLAVLQVALVATVIAKYELDRQRLPRTWVRTAPVDPEAVIRGRYVRLSLVPDVDGGAKAGGEYGLAVVDGHLRALEGKGTHWLAPRWQWQPGRVVQGQPGGEPGPLILQPPVAFFIPDGVPDPTIRKPGEELWAEVSIPKRGNPRPIRLGVMKDGRLTPLTP